MTSYDRYGRPQQTVDPGVAVAGAAAAGILGYAIAKDNHKDKHYHYPKHNYYRHHHRGHR